MIKKMAGALVVGLLASQAFGATSFNWFDFQNTVSPGLPVNRTVLTYTSSDTNVNFDINNPFQSTYGNDSFYTATATIVLPDAYFTADLDSANDTLVGRYAYAVVLDLDFGSYTGLGTIPGGTEFGVSMMAQDSTNPGTPWAIYKTDGTIPSPTQNFYGGNVNLIPEPGSAALVLIGAAAAFLRRRQNRR